MKLISLLSVSAVFGLSVSAFALSAGLYALATIALLLLVAVRDYAPRRPLWQPRGRGHPGLATARPGTTENMRLAA